MNKIYILLNILKNSIHTNKLTCKVPYNNSVIKIIVLLYREGFIASYNILNSEIHIVFKYFENKNVIQYIKMHSKPGRLIYWSYNQLKKHSGLNRTSLIVLSNSINSLTIHKDALLSKSGGLILFEIK